jgi:hypothetical protein
VAAHLGSLSPDGSARTRRWCGLAVTYGAKSGVLLPPSPRALERLASPLYYDLDAARSVRFGNPQTGQHEADDPTDRASRALPDQEQRKWTRSLLQAAPRWRADIY